MGRTVVFPSLFVPAFLGAFDGDDVEGICVKGGADGFDLARLSGRCGFDGHVVVAAIRQAHVGEDEVAVFFDGEVVRPIQLQHQPLANKAGNSAPDS